jgi:hypothetical protein
MPKRTITIRGVSDAVLKAIRAGAEANRRSLNSELLVVLEKAATEVRERSATDSVREKPRAPYLAPGGGLGIAAVSRPALDDVCRRYHIRSLAAFGSWARGQARPESDVDLVAEFEPGQTPGFAIMSVEEALRPLFGGRRVDLVTVRGLSPALHARIRAEAVPLYGA